MINESGQLLVEDAAVTEDNTWLRVPAVLTKEGVQNKKFKPFTALQGAPSSFEGAPVMYTHPGKPAKGQNLPGEIGHLSNVQARAGKRDLWAMVNLNKKKAPADFLNLVRNRQALEGSIGFRAIEVFTPGFHENTPYDAIQTALNGDHYAVGIPVGACTSAQGCGLLQDNEVCTVLSPVDIEGVKMVKLEDMQGWIKNNLFPRIKAELPPDIRERILTSDELALVGVEDMSAEEVTKLARQVAELEVKMNASTKATEDATTALNTALEAQKTAEKDRDEALGRLKPFETKAQTDATAAHDATVKEILTLQKLEDTPENRAVYKDWQAPQLDHLKGTMGPAGVDRGGIQPPGSPAAPGAPAVPGAYVPSIAIRGKGYTIGDMSGKGITQAPAVAAAGTPGAEQNPRR